MTVALVPHWTTLDAIGVWAEAAAALAAVVLAPWLWARSRKSPKRPVAAVAVSARPRDTHTYEGTEEDEAC